MRKLLIITVGVGALALAACGDKGGDKAASQGGETTTAESGEIPELIGKNLKVKAGLWESEVTDNGEVTKSQNCVGADGIPLTPNGGSENAECQPVIKTSPGKVSMTSDCTQSGVRIKMDLQFKTSQVYSDGEMKLSVITPDGKEDTSTMKMKSRWVADACPADLPVGETKLVGGDE